MVGCYVWGRATIDEALPMSVAVVEQSFLDVFEAFVVSIYMKSVYRRVLTMHKNIQLGANLMCYTSTKSP